MRFRAIVLASITLLPSSFASPVARTRLICPSILKVRSPAWKAPETRRLRLEAVIAHQNRIRETKNLPKLSGVLSNSVEERGILEFYFDTIDVFPDHPVAGSFIVAGDVIVRSTYNDIFSLNYVYFFKEDTLVKVEPFGTWYLEQISLPTIALYRQMSSQEFTLWKKGRFEELGKNWGHGTKVVHFSTDREFTSFSGSQKSPIVKIEIPKSTLLRWSKNSEIWAGLLNDEMVSEFVVPYERIGELYSQGALKIEYLGQPPI